MKKVALAIAFLMALPGYAHGQSAFDGTWATKDFAKLTTYLTFKVDGKKVTGTISRADAITIRNGAADGNAITFDAISADGERTVSFVGKLSGDTIAFTRSVKFHDENGNAGPGIFGAKGPMQFTAKRDATADTGMEAQYGNWKLNLAKSHYDPKRALPPVVPDVLAMRALGAGQVEVIDVGANEVGTPFFAESIFKADGGDYPIDTQASVDTILAGAKPPLRTNSTKIVDANSADVTFKINNVVTTVMTSAVSQDGQTLTQAGKNLDPSGKQIGTFAEVYERIP